jgi:hypothetical protein
VREANFQRTPVAARERLHAAFGFPILLGGEVLGVIEFFSREIRQPDQELLEMLATNGTPPKDWTLICSCRVSRAPCDSAHSACHEITRRPFEVSSAGWFSRDPIAGSALARRRLLLRKVHNSVAAAHGYGCVSDHDALDRRRPYAGDQFGVNNTFLSFIGKDEASWRQDAPNPRAT